MSRASLFWAGGIALLAFAFVFPALPGLGHILGGDDLLYFRPPFAGLRPPDLALPSNALLADAVEVFHPDLRWMADEVHAGRLPLWNAEVGAGWPAFASQQTAPLFPTNLPAFVLPFWSSLGLIAALKLALTATGMALFCRRALGLAALPAALAAVAYAAGSYQVGWLEHPHSNVYALLPFLLLAIDAGVRRPGPGSLAAVGTTVGLILLGGHPQSAVILGCIAVPWLVWRLAPAGRRALGPIGPLRGGLLTLAGGALLGVAAAAVVLFPLLEFIGASITQQRGGLGGIGRSSLLTVALPELWGRPDALSVDPGPLNYLERTIYVGAPALLLAVAGLAVRRGGAQVFFALMAVAGAALAVQLPLVTDVVDNVPPFSLAAMIRALVIPAFCLAALAGLGLQALLEADAAAHRRAVVAAAATVALPLLYVLVAEPEARGALVDGLGAVPLVPGEPDTVAAAGAGSALRWLAVAGVSLALIVVLWRRRTAAVAIAAALLALQAADLVELGRGEHPIVSDRVVELDPTPALARAAADQGDGRTTGDDDYLLPNQGERFGLRDFRARGQPTIGRVDRLVGGYTNVLPRQFDIDGARAGDVLDVFGVTQALTGDRPADPVDPELGLVTAAPGDRLYRNAGALPRAYLAPSWRTAPGEDDALSMTIYSTTQQLRDAPVIEAPGEPHVGTGAPTDRVRFVEDGDANVTLDVESAGGGRLVLLDAYFPGWTATVNGEDAEIAPANGAFRSVLVPAGRSRVEFAYRPLSVYAGAAVSVVAWLTLLAAALLALRRRRAHRAAATAY